ncbi:hypothetical protein K438DRAFT_1775389 [Mycena galopus ATCC 62051]|nr:hypothetical protein K438DRAFT_1775389 [Mycena galopus ATCC 62051]
MSSRDCWCGFQASSWIPFGMRNFTPVPWALFVLDRRESNGLRATLKGKGPVGRTASHRKQPQRKEGEIEPDDDIDTNMFEVPHEPLARKIKLSRHDVISRKKDEEIARRKGKSEMGKSVNMYNDTPM